MGVQYDLTACLCLEAWGSPLLGLGLKRVPAIPECSGCVVGQARASPCLWNIDLHLGNGRLGAVKFCGASACPLPALCQHFGGSCKSHGVGLHTCSLSIYCISLRLCLSLKTPPRCLQARFVIAPWLPAIFFNFFLQAETCPQYNAILPLDTDILALRTSSTSWGASRIAASASRGLRHILSTKIKQFSVGQPVSHRQESLCAEHPILCLEPSSEESPKAKKRTKGP